MKKLQTRITAVFLAVALVVAICLTVVGVLLARYATMSAIEKTLAETASIAATTAQNAISSYTYTISEIAAHPLLIDDAATAEEKCAYLQSRADAYYMRMGSMADARGYDSVLGVDISKEPFFQNALAGKTYMSTPYVTADRTDAYLMIGAPIFRDETVVGVAYFQCDVTVLQNLMANLSIGDKGTAYILDNQGTTIAYTDLSLVLNQENGMALAAANPGDRDLQVLAEIERRMVAGETDCAEYYYEADDTHSFQSFAPIPGSDGWSVAVTVDKVEFMRSARIGTWILIAILAITVILAGVVSVYFGRSIAQPIVACTERIQLLAAGDLTTPVPDIDREDEIGQLVESSRSILTSLGDMIQDMSYLLAQMGNGNFDLDFTNKQVYVGDFSGLLTSMQSIQSSLSHVLSQIHRNSEQINEGAGNVAHGAQELAQGANQQTFALENLSSSISGIVAHAKENTDLARMACDRAQAADTKIHESDRQMEEMNLAMAEITNASQEISKIIAAIENIAFQTNILALNASVEAARAGNAGKGFAVVADEVRNLAAKSDEAAKATKELIDRSIDAVRNGSTIAQKVNVTLQETTEVVLSSINDMHQVSDAVEKEAASVEQLNIGLGQIAAVVHSNSSISDASAAASQELSAQAHILKDMVGQFNLPGQSNGCEQE